MFNNLIQEIDSSITSLGQSLEALQYLKSLKRDISSTLEKYEANYNNLISNNNDQYIDYLRSEAQLILDEEIRSAVRVNTEFEHEVFLSRLMEVAYDPRTITILQKRIGRKIRYDAKINFNAVGGSIREWGKAVTQTRKKLQMSKYAKNPLGFKSVPLDAEWASYMWKEKYYMPAREGATSKPKRVGRSTVNVDADRINQYWVTIRTRLSFCRSKAPFWQILDRGEVSLSSDRGGTPYPNNVATNFVQKAEARIKQYTNQPREEVLEPLMDEINKLIRVLDYINDLIKESSKKDLLLEETKKQLGSRYNFANLAKLNQVLDDIIAGNAVRSEVYLGSYQGKRIRMRTKRLQRMAGG